MVSHAKRRGGGGGGRLSRQLLCRQSMTQWVGDGLVGREAKARHDEGEPGYTHKKRELREKKV